MEDSYVVIGAGGHSRVVLDALILNGREIVGLTDMGVCKGTLRLGYPVLGSDDILEELYQKGVRYAALGLAHMGKTDVRNRIWHNSLKIGFEFPNVIHPTAVIAHSAVCGTGNVFLANCVVNAEAHIGDVCIVNTAAVVEHEVVLGDGVHIAPHAIVLGAAHIGENSFIGAGSVILQGVHVGANCTIGAGCIVRHDVEDNVLVAGNPGKIIRKWDGR